MRHQASRRSAIVLLNVGRVFVVLVGTSAAQPGLPPPVTGAQSDEFAAVREQFESLTPADLGRSAGQRSGCSSDGGGDVADEAPGDYGIDASGALRSKRDVER